MILNSKKIGKFSINIKAINENPKLVLAIMSEVIVVKAELIAYRDEVEYHGISDRFHTIIAGSMIPKYRIIITDIEGKISIEFRRDRNEYGNGRF